MSATETHVHIERADRIKIFANSLYQPLQCTGGTFHAEPNSRNIDGKLMLSAALLADFEEGTFSTRDFVLLKKSLVETLPDGKKNVPYLKDEADGQKLVEICNDNYIHLLESLVYDEPYDDSPAMAVQVADYLRSKGYALPYGRYSVEQLVAAGIYKLTEK